MEFSRPSKPFIFYFHSANGVNICPIKYETFKFFTVFTSWSLLLRLHLNERRLLRHAPRTFYSFPISIVAHGNWNLSRTLYNVNGEVTKWKIKHVRYRIRASKWIYRATRSDCANRNCFRLNSKLNFLIKSGTVTTALAGVLRICVLCSSIIWEFAPDSGWIY